RLRFSLAFITVRESCGVKCGAHSLVESEGTREGSASIASSPRGQAAALSVTGRAGADQDCLYGLLGVPRGGSCHSSRRKRLRREEGRTSPLSHSRMRWLTARRTREGSDSAAASKRAIIGSPSGDLPDADSFAPAPSKKKPTSRCHTSARSLVPIP